jgi:hypothetical protein
MGWSPTLALSEPRPIGTEIDTVNGRVRLVAELTRDEYFADLERRRQWNRDHGVPWRAGLYTPETKEFQPGKEVPAQCQYFYQVQEVIR